MNKFSKMLMTDGRNPYGSRGGYVRDHAEDYARGGRRDYNDDYARGSRRDYGENYHYTDSRMGDMNDFARSGRGRGRDYADMRYDYATYNDRMDYGDMRRRDYGEPEMFSKKDMETWKSMMRNEDGSRGEHFRAEQVKHACQQAGIDCEEFGEHIFCLAMNMMYSDYCKVAKHYGVDTPEFYAQMAKAFLRDKDFDGKPEEKLYLYYKAIVEKDD